MKADNEVTINNIGKAQIAEVGESKRENCSLHPSIKQVQELFKDTLAFKEYIEKEIQNIYKNTANDQVTLRNDIERFQMISLASKKVIICLKKALICSKT